MQTKSVPWILQQIQGWKSIKHLSFFNSLIKPFPDQHNYDQSSIRQEDLQYLATLPNLESLGLCRVGGPAIVRMPCLSKLKTLRLQDIPDIKLVLQELPKYQNIEEIWLVDVKIQDADLEPLTRMKNLRSLRLSRDKVDGDILVYLRQMKNLKKLSLDDYLEPAIGPQLKKIIPDVSFSCPVDDTYWQIKAGKPVADYFKDD